MSDTPKADEAVIEGEFVEAPGAAASRRRRLRRRLPWALALLLVVFVAGLLAAPGIERRLRSLGLLAAFEATASSSRVRQAELAALRARLDALDGRLRIVETGLEGVSAEATALRTAQTTLAQRLSALETAPAAGADAGTALAALSARIDGLEARLARLAAAPAGGAPDLAAKVAALERRVAALETSSASPPAADLARHLLALDAAIEAGRPFADILAALQAAIAKLPADTRLRLQAPLESLRPYAATGVAPLAALKARFDGIATAVLRAASPPPGAGWWARLKDRLADLVVIRRTGAVAGTGIAARLARAEAALARDDPAAAVAEIEAIDDAARAPAAAWLDAARRHLAARRALDRLVAAITAPRAASEG